MAHKQKIAIIGTVGLPANYGGFETLTEHLVKNMGKNYDITVYCSGKKYPRHSRRRFFGDAKLRYIPLEANGVQSIFYDSLSIIHSLFYADVILVLGVAGAWMLPFVRLFTNKKIIISIDGIEWKRGKWNLLTKCYLWWAESLAVKYSHMDISDNESIQDYTAMRYGSKSAVIEYGADHTMVVRPTENDKLKYSFLRKPYAFKVCRIEPENNIHEVLAAFAELPRHKFVIVGNWNKSEYGRTLRTKYQRFENILMMDPIYNQREIDMLRGNALVYIHGHSAGGTNPSLVEAMYLGLPVIAYKVSYNKTTTENRALYFKDAETLKLLIQNTSVARLTEIGSIMKAIAQRRYTWKLVAEKFTHLIEETITDKSKVSVSPALGTVDKSVLLQFEAGHLKHSHHFYEKR